ncbi:MAG: ISNCY family transposase [Treponema sp.]|nr:ISNCY family transposase [Treponema sp.]
MTEQGVIRSRVHTLYLARSVINHIKKRTLEAALRLGVTQRCIQYNIKRFKKLGDPALVHGNTGKIRINEELEKRKAIVLDIFQNTRIDGKNPYEKITYSYFTELLNETYGIHCSRNWVQKLLNSVGYETPEKYKIKKNSACHTFRERKEYFGELVQADGSSYDWFGNGHQYCIQGYIDDSSGIPTGLYMTKNECMLGYNEAFRYMAIDYGLPAAIYPDRASVFFDNSTRNKKRPLKERNLTQFGKIMERLGVDMFPAYSPQAKGRIERFWRTLKQRLPVQFRLHGIKTVDEANEFLRNVYIPKYIKRFAVKPKKEQSLFVKADMKEINSCVHAVFIGKTDRSGVFSLKGYRFFCRELINTKIRICLSEKDGLWIEKMNDPDRKRYNVVLCETDTSGTLPEVYKILIEKIFLQNAKPKFREVYYEMNEQYIA